MSDLGTILDQTHDALLRGDLPALQGLAENIDRLKDLGGLDIATATTLRRKAERNQSLLQAAAKGLRTARGRLAEISAEPALTTYDARGRKASVGQVDPGVPKRF